MMEQKRNQKKQAAAPSRTSGKRIVKNPKRLLEHQLNSLNVIALIVCLTAGTVFMLFGKRPTKSEEENRDLTACPQFSISSYLNGTFTSQFSQFFNDTVPMRSTFKGMISDFRGSLGVPYDEGVIIIGNVPDIDNNVNDQTEPSETEPIETTQPATQNATEETNPTETTEVPETTEATTEPEEEEDYDGEIANNILIIKDRGIMLYGGGFSNGQKYAETLNKYKAELGTGVNVYSLVAPTAVSYYLPKKYESYTASEIENINHINSFFDGVTPVDAYSILGEHKKEAIYSRTDHHWQPLGAYYAAQAFAETAGVPFAPLSDYETVTKEGYVGTLYGYTNQKVFKDNPEPFVYYKPKNQYTTTYYNTDMTNERQGNLLINLDNVANSSWYLVFMGGDERITRVQTDCTNGRKLMIIKDSYGNALVPCLTQSFSEIWVADMRYFEPGVIDFVRQHGITDVLFAMNTYSATGGNSKKLQKIMY
ncbi:MAG: hypothetical protein IKK51_01735 [Oscillospiraceae bacterium]|nr:hypothetical protein [Oscillospiraceae bacterium]